MQAADIYRKLRKQGITIRKTNDGIIAATALDHHCQLLHKDKDFASMAKHFPLKVVKPWLQAHCTCVRQSWPAENAAPARKFHPTAR